MIRSINFRSTMMATVAAVCVSSCGGNKAAVTPTRPSPVTTATNQAPNFVSASSFDFFENGTGFVFDANASDQNGDSITYSISGGADSALFSIDARTGAVRALQSFDFEASSDANGDGVLELELSASDGRATAEQNVSVTILDAPICQLPDPLVEPKEVRIPACFNQQVMFTRGNSIFDASQAPFIARGVNLQYGDQPRDAAAALPLMDDIGANIVRLQLRRNTSAREARRAIDALINQGHVVMAFFWETDTTGGTDFDVLKNDVERLWLDRWRDVLLDPAYTDKLMINIVNEWGDEANNFEDYLQAYERLIPMFREAGFWHPLVIDAPNFGQNIGAFQNGGAQRLQAADALNNMIFSLHAYNFRFNTADELNQAFDDLATENIPWLWGEFGDREFEAPENDIDHLLLMNRSQSDGIGWIAWSWHGNGSQAIRLDMSTQHGAIRLTRRGDDIINGTDGLLATSMPANSAP